MRKNWKNKLTKNKGQLTMGFPELSIVNGLLSILIATISLVSCETNKQAEQTDTYICPMHPTVVSDRPSTCPVCGMDLVRKARPGEEVKITDDLAKLIKSPNEIVIADIRTIKGEFKSRKSTIEVTGLVTYDTRNVYTIPTRIGGRLEKVYLKYVQQPVQNGQRVADIYSPELLTAQRELLYLIEHDEKNTSLIESARNKLQLLGANDSQIADLIKTREPVYTFPIFSAQNGYVISNNTQAPALSSTTVAGSGGGMSDGMGATTVPVMAASVNNTTNSSSDLIRAGNYVSAGETLFKVISNSSLRIELNIPVSQVSSISVNDELQLQFGNHEVASAKVDFIQPFFTEGEEFLKLRVYVKGKELRIGQLVNATIEFETPETLWLPKEAVVDLGIEKTVFVKERGSFRPKTVTAGVQTNGWIEIKQGLLSSDEVAFNGQYLVDSESFIKSK